MVNANEKKTYCAETHTHLVESHRVGHLDTTVLSAGGRYLSNDRRPRRFDGDGGRRRRRVDVDLMMAPSSSPKHYSRLHGSATTAAVTVVLGRRVRGRRAPTLRGDG